MASPPRGSTETRSGSSTRVRGQAAERFVAEHLEVRGLEIVDRNFTASGAEVDLVARESTPGHPETYVFVEVRSRASRVHGSPLESVDRRKQARIVRAATAWLVANDLWERVEVRFDVVAVELDDEGDPLAAPTWIRAAFELGG